jgi:hypothetical protein
MRHGLRVIAAIEKRRRSTDQMSFEITGIVAHLRRRFVPERNRADMFFPSASAAGLSHSELYDCPVDAFIFTNPGFTSSQASAGIRPGFETGVNCQKLPEFTASRSAVTFNTIRSSNCQFQMALLTSEDTSVAFLPRGLGRKGNLSRPLASSAPAMESVIQTEEASHLWSISHQFTRGRRFWPFPIFAARFEQSCVSHESIRRRSGKLE